MMILLQAVLAAASCIPGQGGPCYPLTIQNANPLPSTVIIWACTGAATVCTQDSLYQAIQKQTASVFCPTGTTLWSCVTFSQSKNPQVYNFPVAYGTLMNFAVQATSPDGVSMPSPIQVYQVTNAVSLPIVTAGLVGSGSSGVQ